MHVHRFQHHSVVGDASGGKIREVQSPGLFRLLYPVLFEASFQSALSGFRLVGHLLGQPALMVCTHAGFRATFHSSSLFFRSPDILFDAGDLSLLVTIRGKLFLLFTQASLGILTVRPHPLAESVVRSINFEYGVDRAIKESPVVRND